MRCENSTRRRLLIASASVATIATLGCASKPPLQRQFTYQERILNILAAPDRSQLVIVGNRYQYLFDDKHSIGHATTATFGADLRGSFGTFTVYPDNRISGTYRVRTQHALAGPQRDEAQHLGFVELPDGCYELSSDLSGTRFTTSPIVKHVEPSRLDPSFTISIDVMAPPPDLHPHETPPVLQALDALGFVLLVPLIAVEFIFMSPCITCK